MDRKIYSVSRITDYIKDLFAGDNLLNDIWVVGEISNFHHHSSGHMYFTLKDSNTCLNSLMFKGYNRYLKYKLEDGMKVNAHGYIDLYKPRGSYQFYIDKIEPAGKGALYLAFEQLKEKLEKEGLFASESKKKIPMLPKKIGIVTSPTGAAIRDILSVVKRRFAGVSVLIVPSRVQGDMAKDELISGIDYLNKRSDIDLIIISRGGGSIEDLWPFNEEIVARAIYHSKKPIISGVGHETDFTISDFVADLRAPTPSAAAELAISSREEIEKNITGLFSRLKNAVNYKMERYRENLTTLKNNRVFSLPEELYAAQIQERDELVKRFEWAMEKSIGSYKERFTLLNSKLNSLSPLKTLERGYSIVSSRGKLIRDVSGIKKGDYLDIRLSNGTIKSIVEETEKEGEFSV